MIVPKIKKFEFEKRNLEVYKSLTTFLGLLINQICFYYFFIYFSTYMKMSKDLSAKYYQDNKERLQEKDL